MGIKIENIHSYNEFGNENISLEKPRQVFELAKKSIQLLLQSGWNEKISHIIVATTCPDMMAPSLGQMIHQEYEGLFESAHTFDIIQGCAGGVSSMILGSQLSEMNRSNVLIINADAAKKATYQGSKIHSIFGNGSFVCVIKYDETSPGLLNSKTKHYNGLSEVVKINIGHDSDVLIQENIKDMETVPRKHLGLQLNNVLAVKLLMKAENFYLDFIKESSKPDVLILHQANPDIVKHLGKVFAKHEVEFINVAKTTGNCGAATVGIAFSIHQEKMKGKKVMLCSYGTGGVITAGMWQF